MLGKLMKYEIKATARAFLPVYGAVLIMAVIARLTYFRPFLHVDLEYSEGGGAGGFFVSALYSLTWFLFFAFIIAMFVITFIVAIQRFYKNLTGDEGYLMFTLPVPTWMLTTSKLLVAAMWMLASIIATLLSIFILIAGSEFWQEFRYEFANGGNARMLEALATTNATLLTQAILITILSIFSSILPIYLAISLGGHLWPKHRILGSVGAYLIIVVAEQIVVSLLVSGYFAFTDWNMFYNPAPHEISQFINTVMILSLTLSALLLTGYFILTNFLLSKKLNLE